MRVVVILADVCLWGYLNKPMKIWSRRGLNPIPWKETRCSRKKTSSNLSPFVCQTAAGRSSPPLVIEKKTAFRRFFYKAGRQGFEPWVGFYSDNHLAGGPDRPLWHLPNVRLLSLAEEVGFEPTIGFPIPVFKTGALSRSAIPP